jgi:hypothetical protein
MLSLVGILVSYPTYDLPPLAFLPAVVNGGFRGIGTLFAFWGLARFVLFNGVRCVNDFLSVAASLGLLGGGVLPDDSGASCGTSSVMTLSVIWTFRVGGGDGSGVPSSSLSEESYWLYIEGCLVLFLIGFRHDCSLLSRLSCRSGLVFGCL